MIFVIFISIHLVIVCVVLFGAHMRRIRLYPLNPVVTALHQSSLVPHKNQMPTPCSLLPNNFSRFDGICWLGLDSTCLVCIGR
jgi:hypothetical protein